MMRLILSASKQKKTIYHLHRCLNLILTDIQLIKQSPRNVVIFLKNPILLLKDDSIE